MKKLLLAALFAAITPSLQAQVTLTGTTYYQNFNSLSGGLPTGWSVADSAKTNFPGSVLPGTAFYAAATAGTFGNGTFYSTRGGFKNYPSANVIAMGADSLTQVAATDRALGVRQVGNSATTLPNSDPGAAFIFKVANTTGFKNFTASFKLQSLDTSSPRVTTWRVDYAIGAAPTTFSVAATVTSGSLTTGGHTFKNDSISINFDTVLNNKSQNVWIRIVTVDTSTGTGNRATSCIDDFRMSWANITTTSVNEVVANSTALQVDGKSTANNVTLRYTTAEPGEYKLFLTDLNGRVRYTNNYIMTTGSNNIPLNGLELIPGMYVARISNGNTAAVTKIIVQ